MSGNPYNSPQPEPGANHSFGRSTRLTFGSFVFAGLGMILFLVATVTVVWIIPQTIPFKQLCLAIFVVTCMFLLGALFIAHGVLRKELTIRLLVLVLCNSVYIAILLGNLFF
jgi:hypothetical protein